MTTRATTRRDRSSACARDARGTVLIEFLIAFIPVLLLFLGTTQLALVGAARLIVQHAAVIGVRSAIVVLHDDPRAYAGAGRGQLVARTSTRGESNPAPDGPRMATIRRAVYAKLAAIAPDPSFALVASTIRQPSVAAALGATPSDRLTFGLDVYLPAAAAITFPVEPGARELYESLVPEQGSVTLRVTYLCPCTVPIVAGLVCERVQARRHGLSAGYRASDPRERTLRELAHAPQASAQAALLATGVRMAVLEAEATLPSQAARYAYRGEGADEP